MTTVEQWWYQDYSAGRPPRCRRLSRLPIEIQWQAAIEIAILKSEGKASYRIYRNTVTSETTWFIPDFAPSPATKESHNTGWWMIPVRTERRIQALILMAIECAAREGHGDHRIVLRRWRKTGQWRRIAREIMPRVDPLPQPRKKRGPEKRELLTQ